MGIVSDSRKEPENVEYINIGGSFDCQTCDECVDEAHFSPQTNELGWVCSKGHVSKIEDFKLW